MSTNPDPSLDQRWAEAVVASGVAGAVAPVEVPAPVCCCSTFVSDGVKYNSIDAACRLHGLGADVNVRRWARKFVPEERAERS